VPRPNLNPAGVIKDLQERAQFLLNADKHFAEIVDMLKDTRDVLSTLAGVVDRLNGMIEEVESRVGGVGQIIDRMDRLEVAALNIERATLGVEAALSALPKAVRSRITKVRRPGVSDEPSGQTS
jgi:t-SNARE complex subunit (syntaxin)